MSQVSRHRGVTREVGLRHGPIAVIDSLPPAGTPLHGTALLVPGYTGSKEDFVPVLDPLADRGWRLVAMDLPGQYESPGPDTPDAYTVGRLGDVVRSVAAAIGAGPIHAGPIHLVGHSFGGLVARAAAIAEPGRWASLALLDSGPAAISGARRGRIAALRPLLRHGMAAVYDALEELARHDSTWQAATGELGAFLRDRFVRSSPAGLAGMGEALQKEPDRVDELRSVGLPILVAHGEHDDAWSPPEQAEMARRLDARHEPIPAAAHSPAVEQPALTSQLLEGFWQASGRTVDPGAANRPAPAIRR
jgi:pimeloyl-ACP methyl ester carboxylesterase